MQPIFITGPTAVGKTAVAIALARRLGSSEIVSADSMQIYRGADIGTAKPTIAERAAVPHHLLDVCEPDEQFDVRQYVDLARAVLQRLTQDGKRALVVGGTGLYIRALRKGLFEGPPRDPALRAKLELMSRETLVAELERVDPATAATIDRHNPRRLVRALEVFHATGQPISALRGQWQAESPTATGFVLDRDRADLHQRIERRIEEQLAAGWLDEVRQLLHYSETIVTPECTLWQAAGYRELAAHLRDELRWDETVARIKARTRQLARRQLTWFRREEGLVWLKVERDESPECTAARLQKLLMQETQQPA